MQDVDKPCDTVLQQVSIEEILEEQRLQQQAKQETEKVKMQVLKDRGLSVPKADNLDEYWERPPPLAFHEPSFLVRVGLVLFFFTLRRLLWATLIKWCILYEFNLKN